MDAYLCTVCGGAVTHTETVWKCRECRTRLDDSDIERLQKVLIHYPLVSLSAHTNIQLVGDAQKMFSEANGEHSTMEVVCMLQCQWTVYEQCR